VNVAGRQALLARFIADPTVEAAVRHDPEGAAERHGVPLSFARWLAGIPAKRLTSFRKSREHKDAVRAGRKPTRI
jgi:hypothetical protein